MLFEQGVYKIDVDLERTRKWYAAKKENNANRCTCAGCRNYWAAVSKLSPEFLSFLEKFGIDPEEPAEVSAVVSGNGKVYYDGWFHICGTILEGKEAFVQIAPRCTQVNPDYQLHIGEDYTVFFHNQIGLLREDFPRPVIQMEVAMYIPWVLDEKDPYEY